MTAQRVKIICVDDDPELLRINSSVLRFAGLEVLEASAGNECLSLAKKEHPDLILTDVILPDVSGFDLCRLIKADPELTGTYVMLISGMETSSDIQIRGLEMGADGYIVRPVSGQELLARVQAVIRIKQSEMQLRRRMERYQILVETMNDGLGVLDENGMVTFVNDRVCEMIGFSKEEIIGRLVTDFIDDGYRQIFMTHFEEHKEGVIRSFELTCVKKSGEKIHFIVSPKPILDDEGNFRGAFAVMTDITGRRKYEETIEKLNEELELRVEERTRQLKAVVEELEAEIIERKRIEIALKESEAKFRAITRTATDAIVLMDDEGKISYWNPAAEKIFGYTRQETLGKDLHLLLAPREYYQAFLSGFHIFRKSGQGAVIGKTLEFLAIKKDGTRFSIEISTSVINLRGKWEAVGIIRDVTERKLDEKTLRQYAELLFKDVNLNNGPA